jgi:hypothetical protein
VTISGNAKYVRINDPHLGTDINDYVITGDGYRSWEKLPAFAINALNKKFGSAGNIPGPSSAEQALTGLLFPPLIAAIGYALQELLKPKPGGVAEVFSDYTRSSRGAARKAAAKEADESGSTSQEISEPAETEYEEPETENEFEEETHEEIYEETSPVHQEATQKQLEEVKIPEQPEPLTVTVVTDHTGRTKEITYDPQTDEWITEDGNLFNWEVYEKIVLPNLEKDKAWIEQQREKMMEPTKIEKAKEDEHEKYIRNLEKKYGVDRDRLKNEISRDIDKNQQNFEKFKSDADWYNDAYKAAKVTQIIADNAIDGLAACTGAPGKFVRAVYKASKAFVPDEKGGITLGKAIGAGTDIASDFIPFSSPWKEATFKTVGSSIGGAVDEGWDGFKENLIDSAVSNSFEAFAKTIGGKGYGNDTGKFKTSWWNPEMSNLFIQGSNKNIDMLTSSTNKDISRLIAGKMIREVRLQGTKTAAAYTSEMYVKPMYKGD